ncbi:MAG: hypothetical protein A2X14_01440 [Bacteroidetes bacterium GWD2_33_33]|nr:MAG: hypothetical protein A2X14_01440 [Bacteroidetes bacterium GWD2_33_33]
MEPDKLISPNFHNSNNRHWYLLRILLKKRPTWATKYSKKKIFIFREIAYVNDDNELVGLGRSYIPFGILGLSIFLKCIGPFKPKPLGVVLKKSYPADILIEVISDENIEETLTPFRDGVVKLETYKRILTIKGVFKILVEEDFIV